MSIGTYPGSGRDEALGLITEAEAAAGNGTLIALIKRLRTLIGRVTPANPTVASGALTAGAIAAVVADSGALAAGVYLVEATLGFSGTLVAGKHMSVEHRDAANAANIHLAGLCPGGESIQVRLSRVVVAVNERIRVVMGPVAGGAAEVSQASIRCYLLDV